MPHHPAPTAARRQICLDIPEALIEHLDARAAERLCSRSALVRQLILDDMDRAATR